MNRLQAAFQVFKSWGQPASSQSLLQVLNGAYARDGDFDALEDVVKVATLHRAVQRIAMDLAAVPLVIERKRGAKWVEIDEDSRDFGGVARVFKQANPYEGKTALWTRFHQSAELTGSAYLLTDYENAGAAIRPSQPPKSLRVLRADAVQRVFDDRRMAPVAYRYTGDGGAVMNLRPDEVLDHRYPHPREDWCGLSPARAAQIYTKIEDELATYQRNFLRQGARGSVLLSSDKIITPEQAQQIKQEWGSTNSGTRNVGGIWITGRGLKAQELNGRRDTDFTDLFRIVKEQVSSALGVPPVFLGDYSNAALANIHEQTPIYVEGTLMSKGTLLEESLTEIVLMRFDPQGQLRARFVWDRFPMVQRMSLEKAKTYFTLVGRPILTVNEAREALNMEPSEGGDELHTDPVPTFGAPGAPPPAPEKARPEPKALRRLPAAKWIDDPIRNEKRVKRSDSISAMERAGEAEVRAYFTDLQERVLTALEADSIKAMLRIKAEVDDLFSEDEEIEIVEGIIARLYTRVAGTRGAEAMTEAGFEPSSFDINDPRVQQFIKDNAYVNGRRIVGTSAERLRVILAETAASGRTLADLTNEIRDLFAIRRHEAAAIARTETVRAYNASSLEAWLQTGVVERVEWLTAKDDAVRSFEDGDKADHTVMDGESIQIGSAFTLTDKDGTTHLAQFPGDPSLPAHQSINCRCTLDPKTEDDAKSGVRVARGLVERLLSKTVLTPPDDSQHEPSMNGVSHA